ncbi:MAG: hypothetical protein ABIO72_01335 [Patescibacteria group bacterium]
MKIGELFKWAFVLLGVVVIFVICGKIYTAISKEPPPHIGSAILGGLDKASEEVRESHFVTKALDPSRHKAHNVVDDIEADIAKKKARQAWHPTPPAPKQKHK